VSLSIPFVLRLDEETISTLEELSKLTKLSKADIIRMALNDFIQKGYDVEDYPPFKRFLMYQKAKEAHKMIKQIRYMMHMRREAEYWKSYIIKVQNKEIKGNPTSKKHGVIINASNGILEKLKELESQLVQAITEYEKLVEVVKVE
jgi:predicted DNA-binding protein